MQPVPLRDRKIDLLFLAFFVVNLFFITYIVDLEQLVIADPAHFSYPVWPPAPLIDLVHWYGSHYDPLLMARPPFWRMTIWIDVICFGPFYAGRDLRVHPRSGLDPRAGAGLVRPHAGQRADHPDGRAVRRDPGAQLPARARGRTLPWLLMPVADDAAPAPRPAVQPDRGGTRVRRFAERYGPWALVAGASEGLGAAFATELASRGLNLDPGGAPARPVAASWPPGCPPVPSRSSPTWPPPEGVAAVRGGRRRPGDRAGRRQRRVLADRARSSTLDPAQSRSGGAGQLPGPGRSWRTAFLPAMAARRPGRHGHHVVAGRAAGLAADHRVRGDEGVRGGAGRGPVGRAAPARGGRAWPVSPARSPRPGWPASPARRAPGTLAARAGGRGGAARARPGSPGRARRGHAGVVGR